MEVNHKRYGLYLLRWRASTPILAGKGILLASMGQLIAAIVANLIGGLIFPGSTSLFLHRSCYWHSGRSGVILPVLTAGILTAYTFW